MGSHPDQKKGEAPIRTLKTLSLIVITYFCTAGGPYGLEPLVASSTPFHTIVAIIVFPWIWSLPQALITAELSGLVQEEEGVGFVLWIDRALGRYFSFQAGYWSCVCNLLDKALYPVLLIDYIEVLLLGNDSFSPLVRWLMGFGLVIFVVSINIRGLEIVGVASYIFLVLTIIPYLVISLLALPQINPSLWLVRDGDVNWRIFLSMLMWNNSGWDAVGLLAAETINPHKTYPKAMMISVSMVIVTYLFPVMIMICLDTNWHNWKEGEFEKLAYKIGGTPLMHLFVVGASSCCLGIFTAMLSTSSREMYSMARMGLIPSFIGTLHRKWGTPWVALIISGAFISILIAFPFQSLLEITVITNAVVTASIFISFIVLRVRHFPLANDDVPVTLKKIISFLPGKKEEIEYDPVSDAQSSIDIESDLSFTKKSTSFTKANPKKKTSHSHRHHSQEDELFRVPMSTRYAFLYAMLPVSLCIYGGFLASFYAKIASLFLVVSGTAFYYMIKPNTK